MRYESPRRWLRGPASTDGDGLGHSPAWLIGPSGATLGRRPDHSITSSARASNVAGISTPIVLAVCRLMTSSNLVACIIGKSAAFSPLRMVRRIGSVAHQPAGFGKITIGEYGSHRMARSQDSDLQATPVQYRVASDQ